MGGDFPHTELCEKKERRRKREKMSRRDGNREEVLAEVRILMIQLLDEGVEFGEFVDRLDALCQENDWLTQFDTMTAVAPLELVRAELVKVSPRPRVVPFVSKN